jgi:hypothetical protein
MPVVLTIAASLQKTPSVSPTLKVLNAVSSNQQSDRITKLLILSAVGNINSGSSETSVDTQRTTRRFTPEVVNLF